MYTCESQSPHSSSTPSPHWCLYICSLCLCDTALSFGFTMPWNPRWFKWRAFVKGLHAEMRQDWKDNVCYHREPSEAWFWGKDTPAEREAAAARLCTRGRQEEMPHLFLLLSPHQSPAIASHGHWGPGGLGDVLSNVSPQDSEQEERVESPSRGPRIRSTLSPSKVGKLSHWKGK